MGPRSWMLIVAALIVLMPALAIAAKYIGGNTGQPAPRQQASPAAIIILVILVALSILGVVAMLTVVKQP